MKAGITSHEEHDEFAADWVRVDGAPVESFVFQAHFADLKVPLLDVRACQTEPRVVDHSPVFVRQRKRLLIEPRHLKHTRATCSVSS